MLKKIISILILFLGNNIFADEIITDLSIYKFSNSTIIHVTAIENECLLLVNKQGELFIWSTTENKILGVYSESMLIDIVKYDSICKRLYVIGSRVLSDSFEICTYKISNNSISLEKSVKNKDAISCISLTESGNVLIGSVLGDVFELDNLNLKLTQLFNINNANILFIEYNIQSNSYFVGYSDGKILQFESSGKKIREIIDCTDLYTFEIKKVDNYYISYSKDYFDIYDRKFKLLYRSTALNTRIIYNFNDNFVVFRGINRYYNICFSYDSSTSKYSTKISEERSFYVDSLASKRNLSVQESNFNLKVIEFSGKNQAGNCLLNIPNVTAITSQDNELFVASNNHIYKYNANGELQFATKLHESENGVSFGTGKNSKYFNVYTNARNSYNINIKTGAWISLERYSEKTKIHIIIHKKDVFITVGNENVIVYEYIPNVIYGDQNINPNPFKNVNSNLKNSFFNSNIKDIVFNEKQNLLLILTSDSTLNLYDLNKGDIVLTKKFKCQIKQIKLINDSFLVLLETKKLLTLNAKTFIFSNLHSNVDVISNSLGNIFLLAQDTILYQFNVSTNIKNFVKNEQSVNQIQLIKSGKKIVFATLNYSGYMEFILNEKQNYYYLSEFFNDSYYLADENGNLIVLKSNLKKY